MKANSTNWYLLGNIAGPIIFTLSWMILGPLRQGYSTISQPVSALAIGPDGIFMRTSFIVTGLLLCFGVIGLSKFFSNKMNSKAYWFFIISLSLAPLGVLWDGIFTMDKLFLHTVGVQVAMGPEIITFPIVGLILRGIPNWKRFGTWMAILSPLLTLTLLTGFMTSVPLSQMATGGGYYGLWQRALGIEVFIWYILLGLLSFLTPGEV